jgi:hypothetical protein
MEDTEKNKEKLLALLKDRNAQDSVEISSQKTVEPKPIQKPKSIIQLLANSPTPFKSLNLIFWITFISFDICTAFVIYINWF